MADDNKLHHETAEEEALRLLEEDAMVDIANLQPDFHILNDHDADWVANEMARLRDEISRVQAAYQQRMTRLVKQLAYMTNRFTFDLEDYARRKLAAGGNKRKSVMLPCGIDLKFRNVKPKLVVEDKEQTIEWLKENLTDALKYDVRKTELNEYIEATGELPPGVNALPAREEFYIGVKMPSNLGLPKGIRLAGQDAATAEDEEE